MATGIKEAAGGVVDFVTQDPMNHVNNIKSGMQESANEHGKTALITAAKRMLDDNEIDQQEYNEMINAAAKDNPQAVKDKLFYENYYGPKADLAYIRNSKNQTAINNLNNFLGSDDFKSMIGNKEIADKLGIPVELLKDEETRVWAAQRIGKLNNESPLEVANIVKSNPGLLNVFQDERAFVATPANEIKKMAAYESKLSLGVFSGLSLAEGGLNAWENSRTNDLAFKMLIGQADDNDVSEWKKRTQYLKTAYQPESLFGEMTYGLGNVSVQMGRSVVTGGGVGLAMYGGVKALEMTPGAGRFIAGSKYLKVNLAQKALRLGNTLGGGAAIGQQEAGGTYSELKQLVDIHGLQLDEGTIAMASWTTGLVNGGIEFMQISTLKRIAGVNVTNKMEKILGGDWSAKNVAKIFTGKTPLQVALTISGESVGGTLLTAGEESLQDLAGSYIKNEAIKYSNNNSGTSFEVKSNSEIVSDTISNYKNNVTTFALVPFVPSVIKNGAKYNKTAKANNDLVVYDTVSEYSQNNPSKKLGEPINYNVAENHMKEIVSVNPSIKFSFVNINDLEGALGEDTKASLDQLGISSQYDIAKSHNGSVQIPTEKLFAVLASNPDAIPVLRERVRFSPYAETYVQVQRATQEGQFEPTEKEIAIEKEVETKKKKLKSDFSYIRDATYNKIMNNPAFKMEDGSYKFEPTEAHAIASLVEARSRRIADLGFDPRSWYDGMKLDITSGTQTTHQKHSIGVTPDYREEAKAGNFKYKQAVPGVDFHVNNMDSFDQIKPNEKNATIQLISEYNQVWKDDKLTLTEGMRPQNADYGEVNSKHKTGRAVDLWSPGILNDPKKREWIMTRGKQLGFNYVKDEVVDPSSKATGPHMHLQDVDSHNQSAPITMDGFETEEVVIPTSEIDIPGIDLSDIAVPAFEVDKSIAEQVEIPLEVYDQTGIDTVQRQAGVSLGEFSDPASNPAGMATDFEIMGTTEMYKNIVRIMENGTIGDMAHEMNHVFVNDLFRLEAKNPDNEKLRYEVEDLSIALGIVKDQIMEDGSILLTPDQKEKSAKLFESYLMGGKSSSPKLAGVFRQFSEWMTDTYTTMRVGEFVPEINDDLSRVFDRMLTSEYERDQVSRLNKLGNDIMSIPEVASQLSPEEVLKYKDLLSEAELASYEYTRKKALSDLKESEKERRSTANENYFQEEFQRLSNTPYGKAYVYLTDQSITKKLGVLRGKLDKEGNAVLDVLGRVGMTSDELITALDNSYETMIDDEVGNIIVLLAEGKSPELSALVNSKKITGLNAYLKNFNNAGLNIAPNLNPEAEKAIREIALSRLKNGHAETVVDINSQKSGIIEYAPNYEFIDLELSRDVVRNFGEKTAGYKKEIQGFATEQSSGSDTRVETLLSEIKSVIEEGSFVKITPDIIEKALPRLNGKLVEEVYGKDVANAIPRNMISDYGIFDPQQIYKEFGYENANDFINDLSVSPSIVDQANSFAKKRMNDEYYQTEQQIREFAIESINNQEEFDSEYFARDVMVRIANEKASEGSVKFKPLLKKAIVSSARSNLMAGTLESSLNYKKFMQDAKNSADDAYRAFKKGDYEAAIHAKDSQLTSIEMAKMAISEREFIRKLKKNIGLYTRPPADKKTPKAAPQERSVIVSMAASMFRTDANQLAKTRLADNMDLFGYLTTHGVGDYKLGTPEYEIQRELLEQKTAFDTLDSSVDYSLFDINRLFNGTNTEGFTLRDYHSLEKAIKTLQHFSNLKDSTTKLLLTNKSQQEVVNEISQAAFDNVGQRYFAEGEKNISSKGDAWNSAKDSLVSLYIGATNVIYDIDGGDWDGPTAQVTTQLIQKSENKKLEMNEKINAIKKEAYKDFSYEEKVLMTNHPIYVQELNNSFTADNMMKILLDWGNEQNREKLRATWGFPEQTPTIIAKYLDERHLRVVESVWDIYKGIYSERNEVHKRTKGFSLGLVESSPYEVELSNGKVITMSGGYFPIIYDKESLGAKEGIASKGARPASTNQSNTIDRTGSTNGRIDLDLTRVNTNINNAIHDVSYREAQIDLSRVLFDTTLTDNLKKTIGRKKMQEIHRAFEKSIDGGQKEREFGESAIRWLRTTSVGSMMSGKVTVMAQMPMDFVNAAMDLGVNNVVGNLVLTAEESDFVDKNSIYIRTMTDTANYDRDYSDIRKDNSKAGSWTRKQIGKTASRFWGGKKKEAENTATSYVKTTENSKMSVNKDDDAFTKKLIVASGMPAEAAAKAQDLGIYAQSKVQQIISRRIWKSAYELAKIDLKNKGYSEQQLHDKSCLIAESRTKELIGSADAFHLSKIQGGHEAFKLFTAFMTPTIAAGRTLYRSAGEISKAKSADDQLKAYTSFVYKFAMISTAQGAIAEILAGRGPDDDEDYVPWFFFKVIEFWAMGTPAIIKDFAEGLGRLGTGIEEKGNFMFSPPGWAALYQLYSAGEEVSDLVKGKGNEEKAFRENLRAILYTSNIPQQLGIWGYNLQDFLRHGGELELKDLIKMRPAPK